MHKGSCLCGSINFEINGKLPAPTACHCTQCRKHTGHYEAGSDVLRSSITIHGNDNVTWYRTENVRRGFCSTCGSSLFFDADGADWIGVSMGAFDTPTDSHLRMHVFVANKGDYYDLADGVQQFQPKE
jgi:hypothetical protein